MDGAMSEPSSLAFPKRPLFPGIPSLRPYPQIGQGACRKVIPKIPTWLLRGRSRHQEGILLRGFGVDVTGLLVSDSIPVCTACSIQMTIREWCGKPGKLHLWRRVLGYELLIRTRRTDWCLHSSQSATSDFPCCTCPREKTGE